MVEKITSSDVDELDKLLPEEKTITTINGEKILIPIVSWKREVQIIRSIGKILASLPEETFEISLEAEAFKKNKKEEDKSTSNNVKNKFIKILLKIIQSDTFGDRLDDLTKIAAQILDKEDTWVEDNLASPQILELIVPFLLKRLGELTKRAPHITESALFQLTSSQGKISR